MSRAVKRDFRTYIRRYTSPNENFEYGHPHSNARLYFRLELKCYKPHKAAQHPTKCEVINDVKLFPQFFDVIQSDVALQNQVHWNCICMLLFVSIKLHLRTTVPVAMLSKPLRQSLRG